MYKKILVPLDGSALAEKALPYAAYLARRMGSGVSLVRAVETWTKTALHDGLEIEADQRPVAEGELLMVAADLRRQDVAVDYQVEIGEAAAVIGLAAAAKGVDLVVMSTHGRGGLARWAYGSVAERVLRSNIRPLMLVPAACETEWDPTSPPTIVVPLDGSPLAEEALAPAKELAHAMGGHILILQVIEPPNMALAGGGMGIAYYQPVDLDAWVEEARPYAEGVAARLQEQGFSASAETVGGYAAAMIHERAQARNAAAVVMASHGRTGLARLAMGSVALGVVHRATTPVLIVRPAGLGTFEAPSAQVESVAV